MNMRFFDQQALQAMSRGCDIEVGDEVRLIDPPHRHGTVTEIEPSVHGGYYITMQNDKGETFCYHNTRLEWKS